MNSLIIQDSKENIPNDFRCIPVQFVFNLKYDGRRKARVVTGGHLTNPDTSEIYSGVVSIKHIRLVLLLADLNDVEAIVAGCLSTWKDS